VCILVIITAFVIWFVVSHKYLLLSLLGVIFVDSPVAAFWILPAWSYTSLLLIVYMNCLSKCNDGIMSLFIS
jgi:hypothetical protein